MNCRTLEFSAKGDERGSLIALEVGRDIPFEVKRSFYIFDTKPGIERGRHAHRTISELVVCLTGSCTFELFDGKEHLHVELSYPQKGLYIGPLTWIRMTNFSYGCVLLVFADDHYDPQEYIQDYSEYLTLVQAR